MHYFANRLRRKSKARPRSDCPRRLKVDQKGMRLISWTRVRQESVIAQKAEKLVELIEGFAHVTTRTPGGNGFVERFLRGIEVVHDEQSLARILLERDRSDLHGAPDFFIGPDQARVRRHFEIPAMECHALWHDRVLEHEAVRAAHANIELAGQQGQANRFRNPPPLEQRGRGPRLEHEARWGIEGSRNNQLTLGLPFRRRVVFHGGSLTFSCCVQ
jgi:hypothetical protein